MNIKIFISYAHADEELYKKLEEHLNPLKYSGKITTWQDQEIPPGADWEDQIDTHLNEADMILLLISSSFIASNYCWNKEVQIALERHKAGTAKVIPIILKPTLWQDTPLGRLQVLPTKAKPIVQWDNQDAAFEDVARGIQKAVNGLQGILREEAQRQEKISTNLTLPLLTQEKPRGKPQHQRQLSRRMMIGGVAGTIAIGSGIVALVRPLWSSSPPSTSSNPQNVVTIGNAQYRIIEDVTIVNVFLMNLSGIEMYLCDTQYTVEGKQVSEVFKDADEGAKVNSSDVFQSCQIYALNNNTSYSGKPVALIVNGTRNVETSSFRNIIGIIPQNT